MFLHFKNLHNNSDNQFARNKLTALNKLVRSGSYMAKNIIGENEITFLDISMLPYIESWLANKDKLKDVFYGLNVQNLKMWFDWISNLSWVYKSQPSTEQLRNHFDIIRKDATT